jgi:hypothetical protein
MWRRVILSRWTVEGWEPFGACRVLVAFGDARRGRAGLFERRGDGMRERRSETVGRRRGGPDGGQNLRASPIRSRHNARHPGFDLSEIAGILLQPRRASRFCPAASTPPCRKFKERSGESRTSLGSTGGHAESFVLNVAESNLVNRLVDVWHRYPEDITRAAGMGLNAFRLGIEWDGQSPRPERRIRAPSTLAADRARAPQASPRASRRRLDA